MRTSTRCSQDKWRTLLAGGIKVFLTLFLLSFFTTGSYGQGAFKPCVAHRWNSGEAWFKNPTTGIWTGIPASGQTQPQGVVGCASAAATESGLQAFKGIYNPADFPITGLSDCFSMDANAFGASLAPPEAGEDIVWFNFDIRPLAGTYQFQIVSNQPVGWALYYVDPADARPNASDPGPTYPPGTQLSGNCLNLKPANITLSGITHGNCGLQGNGWSTITVPSFNKPTNYYLAMWLAPTGTGDGKSTFPNSMSLIYKSRYGCGGSTCTIESVGQPVLSCVNGGTNGYTVCQSFQGSAGRWLIQDPYALDGDPNTIPATSYTVTTYKQDQTTVVNTATYTTLTAASTLTLGIIPDGAVYAKVCATYGTIGQPFSINLVPDPSYNGGQDYVACGDGASFSGSSPTLPTVDGTATPSTINLATGNTSALSAIASGGTGPYTYAWTPVTPDAFSAISNANSANATFTIHTFPSPPVPQYNLQVAATDAIGCKATDPVVINVESTLEPCGIYGPTPVCQTASGLVYTFGDAATQTPFTLNTVNYAYKWSITGNGTITSAVDNTGTVTVNPTGSGTFTLTMTIDNITGIQPDRTCTYTVTVNPTPAAPTGGPNARCGTGTVSLTATGCEGGTLNWYTAASGGSSIGTGSPFTTPSISATTTFYVSCKVGDCEGPRTAVIATVNDAPAAPTGGPNARCGTGTVSLTATGCEGGTLNWYTAASGGSSIGTGSPFTTPSISATTTFYVSCKVGDCEGPRTAVVATVNDIPGAPTGGPNARCGTGTVELTATGCTGTLNWYAAPSGGASIGTGSPFTTPSISSTTTFYVSCTSAAGCEGPRTAVVATVNDIPATPVLDVVQPTCLIAASITVTSPVGAQYTYSLNGGTAQASPVFGNLAPGPYTVTATGTGGCTSPAANATINAVPEVPAAPGAGPNHRCGPGTVELSATGCANGTLNWYAAPSGGASLGTGATFTTPSLTATTTFYVSCTVGDCVSPRTAVVATVNDIPGAPTGGPNARCGTGTVELTASGCEGGTLNWYAAPSGGASIGTGSPFTTPSISATTTFYVSCTSAAGCEGPRTAVVATVNDIPATPQLTVVQPTCLIAASITVTSPVGAQYTYSLNGGTAQASPVFSNLAPGPYTVTATGTGGCTSLAANATINTVPEVPAAPGAGPNSRCGPGTVALSATGCANGTLNWYADAQGGASLHTGATFTTPSLTATTTFYVSCTVGDCVSPRTAVVATVNDIPGAPTGGPNARCGTGTVELTASGCEGGTLNWYAAPSGGASIGTGSPFTTPSISATTTFYVSCTSAAGCEGPRTAVVATVNDIPATPQLTVVQPTCLIAASITVTSPVGAQYTYSLNGGTAQASPVFSNLAPGPYTVTATGTGGCTSLAANATINTVPEVPSAPGAGPNSRCGPGTVALSATGCANGTLNWYADAQGGASLHTGATFTTPSLTATTTFYVSCTVGDCVSPRTAVVATVNDIPGAPSGTGDSRCGPGTVGLSATGCEGGTLNWYADAQGGASLHTGATFTTPSISATTTFYVSCTSAAGCEGPRTAVVATVYDIPATPQLTVVQPTCLIAASITVTSPVGAQYTYSLNGGTAQASPVFSNLAPGPYTVTATGTGGCTSLAANATINTVPEVPSAPGAGPNSRCGPGTVALSATGCANGTLNWYADAQGGASLHTGATFTTPSLTATTTFYVSCTVGDCVSPRTAVVATVNDIPGAPSGTGDSRCGPGTVGLSATGCEGGTLNWYADAQGGASLHTGATFTTPSISATTTFYVSCTSAAGCEGPRTAVVATVYDIPATPQLTVVQPTCLIAASITVTSPVGAQYTYSLNGGTAQASPVFSNLAPGPYTVTATGTGGCTSLAANATINTVPEVPSAPGAGPNSRCGPGTVALSATGCANGTLNWYADAQGGASLHTGATFTTPSLTATTTFYVSCTVGDCVSPRTAVVATVNDIPGAPSGTGDSRCGPGTVGLSATGCEGGTLNWYADAQGGASLHTGATFTTPSISATTTFYVSCTSAAGCEGPRTAVVATVNDIPATPVLDVVQPTCLIAASITVTSPVGAQYTYSLNGGTAQASPVFSNLAPGPYTVTATGTGGCTSLAANATINTVPEVPAAPGAGPNSRCGPGTVALSATGCANGTLNWYADAQGGASLHTGATFTTPSLTATTTFYVSCTVGDCVSPRTAVVATVNDIPGAPSGTGDSRCGPGTVGLSATGCEGGTLNWYADAQGGASLHTGATFTTPSISATTTFYVSCTSAAGCEGPRTAVVATVNSLSPSAIATLIQPNCTLTTGTITVTSPIGESYTYSLNNGSYQVSPVFSGLVPGVYTIRVQTGGQCTSSPTTFVINNAPGESPAAQGRVTQPTCNLSTGTITVTSPLGETYTYSLNNGAYQASPTFSGLVPGTYNIRVQNNGGCTSSPTMFVVNVPPGSSPNPIVNVTQPNCDVATGTITVTSPLGENYTYSLNNGTYQLSPVFSGLAPGNYVVRVQNNGGCTSSGTTVVIIPGQGNINPPMVTVTQPSCEATGQTGAGSTTRIEAENWSAMSGVLTQSTSDAGGGMNVGWIDNGDWIDYAYTAPVAGTYTINLRLANPNFGSQFQIWSGGSLLTTVNVPITGGYQTWQTVPVTVTLAAGAQTIRLMSTANAGWNINWLDIVSPGGGGGGGSTTGTITVTSPLGASYTYSLNNGTFQSSPTFSGLAPGTYTVRVKTTGGCTSSGTTVVINTAVIPNPPMVTVTQPSCEATGQTGAGSTTRIEAENWSAMSGVLTQSTSDAGGGMNVGWIDNGDWIDYAYTAPVAGTYTINLRLANPNFGSQFQIWSGGSLLTTVNVPITGGYQTWQTVPVTVTLAAGAQTIRLMSTANAGWNINWLDIVSPGGGGGGGSTTGTITVTSPLGASYTYSLNNGTFQSSPTFSGLAPGTYTVRVKTTGGCTSSGTTVVINTAVIPNPPMVTVTQPSCEATGQTGAGSTTRIEAENWSAMSGVLTQSTSDAGGGMNVGWIDNGDWIDYAYTAPVAGTYTINLRLANPNFGSQFQIWSGGSLLTTVNVPITGGYQTWQTVPVTVTLAAGAQTIRLMSTANAGWNINWLDIVSPGGGGGGGSTTGTITVTSPLGASYTYSLNNGTFQSSPTFSGLAPGTYTVRVKTTGGCTSSGTTVVINPAECTYCSYTQGFWGNKNGLAMLPGLLTTSMTIGRPGHSVMIPAGSATMLNGFMPGGTTPVALVAGDCTMSTSSGSCFMNSYVTSQGKINNVLLSQTITLMLNTRLPGNHLSGFAIRSGCLVTGRGTFEMNQNVVNYLTYNGATATVANLLDLANDVLGGSLTPGTNMGTQVMPRIVPSYSDVNNAVDVINNAFDECSRFIRYDLCVSSLVTTSRIAPKSMAVIPDLVKVNAYPNPFTDKVRFTIRSSASGQGSLDVFNMVGQKINTVFQGHVNANSEQVVEYRVPTVARQNLIYVFTINGQKVTGKLLNAKE